MGIMNFPTEENMLANTEWQKHGFGTLSFVKGERKGEKYVGEFKGDKCGIYINMTKTGNMLGIQDGISLERNSIQKRQHQRTVGEWIETVVPSK
jgi:hypothetical protein